MAAALSSHPDLSSSPHSNSLSHPDFTLGSIASGFSTPHKSGRFPSTTSRTTATSSLPVQTPSPGPSASNYVSSRRNGNSSIADDDGDDDEIGANETTAGDLLGTPAASKGGRSAVRTRGRSGTLTAGSTTSNTTATSKLSKLTLRDQEKHIDNLKKENFDVKLRVHFLEQELAKLAPDQMEATLKQNINLKVEVQQRGLEIKKLKKLLLQLERELERLQGKGGGSSSRERELEQRLEEKELELEELRRRRVEREEDDDELLKAAESRNAELEEELGNMRALLEENMDEIDRLNELLQRKGDTSTTSDRDGPSSRSALQRKVESLDDENHQLREKLAHQDDLLHRLQDEKEDLADVVQTLELQLEDLHQRRQHESMERSQSRAALLEEQEERENLEDEVNRLRDRVAALQIELQTKEDEVDHLMKQHQEIVDTVEAEWRGEVEEQRGHNEQLKDLLADRDSESKELRLLIGELETNTNDLHVKFEAHVGQLEDELEERRRDIEDRDKELEEKEAELEARDVEMENLRGTIDKLGEQIYLLEDENDKFKEELDRIRDDEALERERLEGVVSGLKERNNSLKNEVEELTDMYQQAKDEVQEHLARQEELARHIEDLVRELENEQRKREEAEEHISKLNKELDDQARSTKRALDAKEAALQTAIADLARAESRVRECEADIAKLQMALNEIERESKKLGESATTTQFSLQLELDRYKRDLERTEDELTRLRSELAAKEASYRDRESNLDKLHAENRDLASQLAAQTQARLNMGEKLDAVQKEMKDKEAELGNLRSRVTELEARLSKDQRSLLQAESMYRDQLTERNTLLLTIYQYLDKILGVDKTPKKGSSAETKPFTNFSVFHDNLITRLKQVSQIQLEFDKKVKIVEGRFTDRLADMKKQLDNRWRQLDKFEASLKVFAETKAQWRKKLSAKEGELEAVKATNSELSSQLMSLKRPNTGDSMEVRSLASRANNAEKRLHNAQNQLMNAEEKIMQLNQRNAAADEKWEARVREYEARLKAAEERVKRERQGSKERVLELENNIKSLQRQLDLAQKRTTQLNEVLESHKVSSRQRSSPSSNNG
ncbi:hypothetical protein CC2G_002136 [Coprinopsis cinerea AmutBmut pab1-1]|nr:hypothetical protein CC2G_002136 [Coprinopsis cinerea AmutBmut pab1-1]